VKSVIICHCEAVSDRAIRTAIQGGAIDLDAITANCGAGGGCGGCHARIIRLLVIEQPVQLRTAS
jgi:bacterioferritin-associated ferredoxin